MTYLQETTRNHQLDHRQPHKAPRRYVPPPRIPQQPKQPFRKPQGVNVVDSPACAGKTELFFSERTADMRAAQVICSGCVLRVQCLEQARQCPPFAGVWGGIIFVNGEEQLLKRGRGRPRKSEQLDNARVLKALAQAEETDENSSQEEVSLSIA